MNLRRKRQYNEIVLNKLMDTKSQNCVKFSYKKMSLLTFSALL